MLMRTDPFREIDRLTQQVFGTVSRPGAVPTDAYRRDDTFYVHFDIPGVSADDIELTVERNVLTVRAERGQGPAAAAGDGVELIAGQTAERRQIDAS